MKPLHCLLALFVPLFTGCDAEKSRRNAASREITVEDLAWATEWRISKWKVGDLTDVKLRQIQLVVIGPTGEVAQEGVSVGYDSVLDSDMEIALALKKVGPDVLVKLRGGGATVGSTMKGVFTGNSWTFGSKGDVHEGLLVVATDSNMSVMSSRSALAESGNKLCLKLRPFHSSEAEQDASGPPATRPASDSEGSGKPQSESEGRSR